MAQPLRLEQLLFLLEDLGEVDLVQAFVGVVDEELLQTVLLQDFEAVDVQEPQVLQLRRTRGLLVVGQTVDLGDDPLEETLVQDLGQRVYQFLGLPAVEVFHQGFAPDF